MNTKPKIFILFYTAQGAVQKQVLDVYSTLAGAAYAASEHSDEDDMRWQILKDEIRSFPSDNFSGTYRIEELEVRS